jgi:hypothetical protein
MPRQDALGELAGKLLQTLREERDHGVYPLTVAQLAARAAPPPPPEQAVKALAKKPHALQVIVARARDASSPVALVSDGERLAHSPLLLEFALGRLSSADKPLHPLAKIVGQVSKPLQAAFKAALQSRLEQNTLPETIGRLDVRKKPHLYLKRYPLPRDPSEVLSEKLVQGLEQRRTGGAAVYPLPLAQLLRETDAGAKPALVKKALAQQPFAGRALVTVTGKPDALVALAEDRDGLAASPRLLESVLGLLRTADNQAVSLADLAKKLTVPLRQPFESAVRRKMSEGSLPPSVGCLRIKKKPHLFLLADVAALAARPASVVPKPAAASPPPAGDFAPLFAEAFDRLDRQSGGHNFVSLVDLRKAIPWERYVFDAELRKLRLAGLYTLSGAEGRHGLGALEQQAGILEGGTLLLFVSRRGRE